MVSSINIRTVQPSYFLFKCVYLLWACLTFANAFTIDKNNVPHHRIHRSTSSRYNPQQPFITQQSFDRRRPPSEIGLMLSHSPNHAQKKSNLFFRPHQKKISNRNIIIRSIHHIQKLFSLILLASTLFFSSSSLHTPPVHASSAATDTTTVQKSPIVRMVSSTTTAKNDQHLESLIQRYIQHHMFDDDTYNHFESTYREAHHDRSTSSSSSSSYPKQVTSVTSQVMGDTATTTTSKMDAILNTPTTNTVTAASGGGGGGGAMMVRIMKKFVDFGIWSEQKFGIGRNFATVISFLTVSVGGWVVFAYGWMFMSAQQKRMTERMAINRYGESSVFAQERVEDDIEAPDDDEDDDEDDEDDDDDDEDEDDE